MRTISGGPCLHYDCTNRNSFGYCKTTVCINQNYQHEQLISTTNRTEPVVVKPLTNADKIRWMSDEELATLFTKVMAGNSGAQLDGIWQENGMEENQRYFTRLNWLDWLKQEVNDG